MTLNSLLTGLCIGAFCLSTLSYANNGRPSPTGWRGPVREAGRPWLQGYALPSQQQAQTIVGGCAANTWCYDAQRQIYWAYDTQAGLYWYYWPQTNSYTYAPAR